MSARDGHHQVGDRVADESEHNNDGPPCSETDGEYICTRDPGHDGQHEAAGTDIVAVWS